MTYRPYLDAARARRQLARHASHSVDARAALLGWSLTAEEAVANAAAKLSVALPTAGTDGARLARLWPSVTRRPNPAVLR